MLRFGCPACHAVMEAPPNKAGQKLACLKCGQRLQIPMPPRGTILAVPLSGSEAPLPQSLPVVIPPSSPAPLPEVIVLPSTQPSSHRPVARLLDHDEEDKPPRRSPGRTATPRKHSGVGMASFVIGLVVAGIDLVLMVMVATNAIGHAGRGAARDAAVSLVLGGLGAYCLTFFLVPVCLVGLGLAVVGLIANRGGNQLFAWLGLFLNLALVVTFLALWVYVQFSSPRVQPRGEWPLGRAAQGWLLAQPDKASR